MVMIVIVAEEIRNSLIVILNVCWLHKLVPKKTATPLNSGIPL